MISRRTRLAIILSSGLILLLGALFYTRYFLSRPVGAGPAGPAVSRDAFAEVWTTRPVQVVGIGDSVTKGLGAASPDHSFFSRLIRNPEDEFADMQGISLSQVLPTLEFENLAMSGSSSCQHADVIDERLKTYAQEVFGLVVMTTGGNDLIHSYGRSAPRECAMYGASLEQAEPWIERFGQRLEAMLNKIESCFPGGCEIYLADIYDPTDGVGDAPSVYLPPWPDGLAIHARYNAVIRRCAQSRANVHIVPLHAAFLGHGAHCLQFWRPTYDARDPHYWFFENIEDPNDRGYDAIRRVFLNTILEHSVLHSRSAEVAGDAASPADASGMFGEG